LKRVHLADTLGSARAIVATRPALHGALLEATEPSALECGREAAGFLVEQNRVSVLLADGTRETGDVLVGADGVASTIRRQIHPAEPPAVASGYVAVRGVAHDVQHLMRDVSAATYLGDGIEASIARASRSAVYWYMSLLAAEIHPDQKASDVAVGAARHLDATFQAIVEATSAAQMRMDALYDRDPIDKWGEGPVTLLGDAAHPMLPHTGQGAAQAIEDAVALGLALAGHGNIPTALRRYERVRAARTRRLIERGRRAAWATTTRNPVVASLRTMLIKAVPARRMAAMFMLAEGSDPHRDLRSSSAG
jgi:2-polyprenyl-6-methoxyphenol hydroxylase-like FAD-dependent oxidoreductase